VVGQLRNILRASSGYFASRQRTYPSFERPKCRRIRPHAVIVTETRRGSLCMGMPGQPPSPYSGRIFSARSRNPSRPLGSNSLAAKFAKNASKDGTGRDATQIDSIPIGRRGSLLLCHFSFQTRTGRTGLPDTPSLLGNA
jgi:hypothetical protein